MCVTYIVAYIPDSVVFVHRERKHVMVAGADPGGCDHVVGRRVLPFFRLFSRRRAYFLRCSNRTTNLASINIT